MALSLGMFSGFVTGETATLLKPSGSPSSVRLAAPPFANLQPARTVSLAASSNPASETKKSPVRGIMKPRRVSPEMQAFLGGVAEAPRTEVVKQVWAHIKQHNLQDPADKKVIVCDDELKKIFGGREQVGFLEIAGLITPHFL
nr:protein TRI1-like [Ipomoea batatas]